MKPVTLLTITGGIDRSERDVLNCSSYKSGQKAGSCSGGNPMAVYDYMKQESVATEELVPCKKKLRRVIIVPFSIFQSKKGLEKFSHSYRKW